MGGGPSTPAERRTGGTDRLPRQCKSISTLARSCSSRSQIFEGLDRAGLPFRRGLRVLQKVCSSRAVLPVTYQVPGERPFGTMHAVAYGGFRLSVTCKGSLGEVDVRVKRLRMLKSPIRHQEKLKQVFRPHNPSLDRHALTSFGGNLQGGRGVEVPQSPEYCTLQGCHFRTPPARVGMDARWRVE